MTTTSAWRAFFIVLSCVLWAAAQDEKQPYEQTGVLKHEAIRESSGVAASRQFSGIFWTHNDGSDRRLFAVTRSGELVGEFKVDAKLHDWEDIAIDDGRHIYVADTGNNDSRRQDIRIYRIDEPDPHRDSQRRLTPTRAWKISYPAQPFNCESFFVFKDAGFLIPKYRDSRPAAIYRFALDAAGDSPPLEKLTDLSITMPVTAADISADGRRLAVLGTEALYVYDIDGDVASAGQRQPLRLPNPCAKAEGCCFAEGGILVTAETREVLFYPLVAPATQPAK